MPTDEESIDRDWVVASDDGSLADSGRTLVAHLTHEGIIVDAFDGDLHVGTFAKTVDEFYDFITSVAEDD